MLRMDGNAQAPLATADLSGALAAMAALESGALANVDEQRQVGHYWLRSPDLAPDHTQAIAQVHAQVHALAEGVKRDVLLIGIGGSALGAQLAIEALADDPKRLHLLDGVDPDGIRRVLQGVDPGQTTVVVASKSGKTVETRVALRIAEAHWARAGCTFADDAIAITMAGSELAALASEWRATLPIWDWVGGRSSISSAVGLLPMALLGIDINAFLQGAAAMDAWTRSESRNPAAALAGVWHAAGERAWVILPYADRLRHLSRYLQQLIMESLGKSHTRAGIPVHHGRAVYGNRGSADQHALVQQLRDGPDDVFVHFIDVAPTGADSPLVMDAADTHLSLLEGTRIALGAVGRPTASITLPDARPSSLGALIALFERAVGIYAELQDLNAYHQPGVEAGKSAATQLIGEMSRVREMLSSSPQTAEEIAAVLQLDPRVTWRLCMHLCGSRRATLIPGLSPAEDRFQES